MKRDEGGVQLSLVDGEPEVLNQHLAVRPLVGRLDEQHSLILARCAFTMGPAHDPLGRMRLRDDPSACRVAINALSSEVSGPDKTMPDPSISFMPTVHHS